MKMIITQSSNDENGESNKYLKLDDAIQKFCIKNSFVLVNIHGIVQSYNHNENVLCIFDETRGNFEISLNNSNKKYFLQENKLENEDNLLIEINVGDIIQIQNLALVHDFTIRCNHIQNCVVSISFFL